MGGTPDFTVVLRGYDRAEVDRYLARVATIEPGEPPPPPPDFAIVLRGYERTQVDRHVADLQLTGPLRPPEFAIVVRGYDRTEVDRFVEQAFARIRQLEATLARLQPEE